MLFFQQISYNLDNPQFLLPPYNTPQKEMCEKYIIKKLADTGKMVGGILGVIVTNMILNSIMFWLIEIEKHYSATTKASSMMMKLFIVQWINTAIVILIVNAQLHKLYDYVPVLKQAVAAAHGVGLKIGAGEYSDFQKEWFESVGIGLTITVLTQIFAATLPGLVTGCLARCGMKSAAKKRYTQAAMDKSYEHGEFSLPQRLAQTMNVVFCVLMFSAGMPVLLWIGAAYCLVAYWADKILLLRFSRVPPMYTEQTIDMSLTMFPWAALLHALLAMWMYGNQTIFPSDFYFDNWVKYVNDYIGSDTVKYDNILSAGIKPGVDNEQGDYYWYMTSRAADCLRGASIFNFALVVLIILYFVMLLSSQTWGKIVKFVLSIVWKIFGLFYCCKHKVAAPEEEEPQKSYTYNLPGMKANHMVYSYKIKYNARYQDAYRAISAVDQKASISPKSPKK